MSNKSCEFDKKKIDSHISSFVRGTLPLFNLRTEVAFGKTEVPFSTVTVVFGFGINRSDILQTEVTFGRQRCLLMYRSDFFYLGKTKVSLLVIFLPRSVFSPFI